MVSASLNPASRSPVVVQSTGRGTGSGAGVGAASVRSRREEGQRDRGIRLFFSCPRPLAGGSGREPLNQILRLDPAVAIGDDPTSWLRVDPDQASRPGRDRRMAAMA